MLTNLTSRDLLHEHDPCVASKVHAQGAPAAKEHSTVTVLKWLICSEKVPNIFILCWSCNPFFASKDTENEANLRSQF